MTLAYLGSDPSDEALELWSELMQRDGEAVTLTLTDLVLAPGQLLCAKVAFELRSLNRHPHITLLLSASSPAKLSNAVLDDGWNKETKGGTLAPPVHLHGNIRFF